MKLSVIGLGKLGSPLAAVLASKGHNVCGVDINPNFVDKINAGIAPVEETGLQELITKHRSKLTATHSCEKAVISSDATFIIVPTPSKSNGLFCNRYLLKAIEEVGKNLIKKSGYHLVVVTSTVTPGSMQGEIQKSLEAASGKFVGNDMGLCYNPEFIALGSVIRNMLYPDMILIGESDAKAGAMLEQLYKTCCENNPPIRRMNLVNAEMAKISVNTFVTTKISYANMLSDICERLPGADANIVTEAIGLDNRIGSKYLKPAAAFGGPCFPRDNIALAALAKMIGARANIAVATQEINSYQNNRLFKLIHEINNPRAGILGLSYKPGTYVVEESQGIALANLLQSKGYAVRVYDPMANAEAKKTLHRDVQISSSVADCFENSDTLLVMIPWPEFTKEITPNFLKTMKAKKTIIDCWRLFDQAQFYNVCDLIHLGLGNNASQSLCATSRM